MLTETCSDAVAPAEFAITWPFEVSKSKLRSTAIDELRVLSRTSASEFRCGYGLGFYIQRSAKSWPDTDHFADGNSKRDSDPYAVSGNNTNPNPTLVADETGKFEERYSCAMNVGQNVLEIALTVSPSTLDAKLIRTPAINRLFLNYWTAITI